MQRNWDEHNLNFYSRTDHECTTLCSLATHHNASLCSLKCLQLSTHQHVGLKTTQCNLWQSLRTVFTGKYFTTKSTLSSSPARKTGRWVGRIEACETCRNTGLKPNTSSTEVVLCSTQGLISCNWILLHVCISASNGF